MYPTLRLHARQSQFTLYTLTTTMLLDIEARARQIEAAIGYTFTSRRLCMEAVQMAAPQIAVIYNGTLKCLENNKRLSVLGDIVLEKLLCNAWFDARDQRGRNDSHVSLIANY
jgi:hypothetical protein